MIYSSKIQKAINYAEEAHRGQKRKGRETPYIVHPFGVGLMLARIGASEDVIIAGLLHDTIEDCDIKKSEIEEKFGKTVAEIVNDVTEQDKSLPWEERKKEALEHIKTFSHSSLLVKSADVISNTSELIKSYEREGDVVFSRFNASKEKVLKHYLELAMTLSECWSENQFIDDLKCAADSIATIVRKSR